MNDYDLLHQVAQKFYQGWLLLNGVNDPQARVQFHPHLGFEGVPSEERARIQGRAYDIIPSDVLVEINRKAANLAPIDEILVRRILETTHAR